MIDFHPKKLSLSLKFIVKTTNLLEKKSPKRSCKYVPDLMKLDKSNNIFDFVKDFSISPPADSRKKEPSLSFFCQGQSLHAGSFR